MAQVKAIQCKITDEYGQTFPQAIAYIVDFCKTSVRRGSGTAIGDELKITEAVEGFAVNVMYWYSAQTKAQGFKARELRIDDGEGGFTCDIVLNMDSPDIERLMSTSLAIDVKESQVMELGIKTKF